MNKQVLSIEQMQHLKELGVDTSKASMVLIYEDGAGYLLDWDDVIEELCHPEPMKMFKTLHDAETDNYDHSYRKYCGVFTLQDILDLLPVEIEKENRNYQLEVFRNPQRYFVSYYWLDNLLISLNEVEFIDAAYEMLCWCVENGYVETNKE